MRKLLLLPERIIFQLLEICDVTRLQELQLELQQRDEAISMKSDEIRRLALQNHEYETQVVFE